MLSRALLTTIGHGVDMGGAGCVVLPLVRLPVGLCFPLLAMGSMGVSGSVLCFAPHEEARDWI